MLTPETIIHRCSFLGCLNTNTTQHTTDSTQQTQYTAYSTAQHTTHTHSPPFPSSVVFSTIQDQLLIAEDVDACLVSILAAMTSLSDQAIVVGGGLAGMSAANTVLEKRWWRVFVGQVHVRHSEGWSEEG